MPKKTSQPTPKKNDENIELEKFRIGGLMTGLSTKKLKKMEWMLFGKTLEDIIRDGYRPSQILTDKSGNQWTTEGKK